MTPGLIQLLKQPANKVASEALSQMINCSSLRVNNFGGQ